VTRRAAVHRLARHPVAERVFRSGLARRVAGRLITVQREPVDPAAPYLAWAELERRGPAPPATRAPADPPHYAFVVPEFRRGSGGHTTIANLIRGLERRGRRCSVWIHGAGSAEDFRAFFGPFGAAVHAGFGAWSGADVAIVTGWQTAAPVLLLEGCGARVHLVQDDEPEFYPASAERLWAEQAFRFGLPCVTAGAWLAERMRERGLQAASFDLGIDHATYRPQPRIARRPGRVLFYARTATPRRAVPLGMLALAELRRRRPDVEVVLYGDAVPLAAPFPLTQLGILEPTEVARAYAEASAGMVLSLTNHSLAAQEMLACGLRRLADRARGRHPARAGGRAGARAGRRRRRSGARLGRLAHLGRRGGGRGCRAFRGYSVDVGARLADAPTAALLQLPLSRLSDPWRSGSERSEPSRRSASH
jgi:glycosyltransferase involved in cell wall biosynthesis